MSSPEFLSGNFEDPPVEQTKPHVPERRKPLTFAIEQRLRLIDFLLVAYGHVRREALCDYFGVSTGQASLDFRLYMDYAPDNMVYNMSKRRYELTPQFKRLYP